MRSKAALRRLQNKSRRRRSVALEQGSVGIGRIEGGAIATMGEDDMRKHSVRFGQTGKGKTTLLESEVRQVILNGHGVVVIDPHGGYPDSLHRNLLRWLCATKAHGNRRIRIVDPSNTDFVMGFNPLLGHGRRPGATAESVTMAFSRLQGEEDLNQKPTLLKMMMGMFAALSELGLTMHDGQKMLDIARGGNLREWMLERVEDPHSHAVIARFHDRCQTSRRDAEIDATGPENRLASLLRDETTRLMVSETENTLNLVEAMDDGDIVLANLMPSRTVGSESVRLIGLLLVRELYSQAMLRRNFHPVHVYIDECQDYIAGAQEILDKSRKFGLHLHLSTQRLGSLREAGEDFFNAVMGGTYTKIIFGGLPVADLKVLVEDAFPIDLERPVEALLKPTVVGQHMEWLDNESTSEGRSRTESVGWSESSTIGGSSGTTATTTTGTNNSGSQSFNANGELVGSGSSDSEGDNTSEGTTNSRSWSEQRGISGSTSHGRSTSRGHGRSQTYVSDYETLASAVHSLENMLHMTARTVKNLQVGEAVAIVGNNDPVWVKIKKLDPVLVGDRELDAFMNDVMAADPATVPIDEARRRYLEHDNRIRALTDDSRVSEPVSYRVKR